MPKTTPLILEEYLDIICTENDEELEEVIELGRDDLSVMLKINQSKCSGQLNPNVASYDQECHQDGKIGFITFNFRMS